MHGGATARHMRGSQAQRVVDPVAQMRAELGRIAPGRGGEGALALLARIAPALVQSPQYRLEGIELRNGVLELAVAAPAVAALDRLRESVSTTPGVQVELAAATATPDGAEGRLRIREGAP